MARRYSRPISVCSPKSRWRLLTNSSVDMLGIGWLSRLVRLGRSTYYCPGFGGRGGAAGLGGAGPTPLPVGAAGPATVSAKALSVREPATTCAATAGIGPPTVANAVLTAGTTPTR